MASVIFTAAGAALGASTGVPYGAAIGRILGGVAGNALSSRLGPTRQTHREGARLEDLAVQSSAYGRTIPLVVGTMRLAGNVIWARPLKEVATTTTTVSGSGSGGGGKGGGGGRVSETDTTYSYYGSCAVAICEGPIDELSRIWADTKLLDRAAYTIRFYNGSETQTPDSLIESIEGVGQAPAYRGTAYVVFEDFPLADFGNRLPNFTFEVRRGLQMAEIDGQPIENLIQSVTLIPGSGEWVYDVQKVQRQEGAALGAGFAPSGYLENVNLNHASDAADAVYAIRALRQNCPNVQWISVVVNWFATGLDAATLQIFPGVEYKVGGYTTPESWQVSAFNRAAAHAIGYEDGKPRFGGTPSDNALIRLVTFLRNTGYKIAFYPILMVDAPGKPWRGHITGSAAGISNFFYQTYGYQYFISHYANLMAGRVDAFIVGSEMKGLTAVTNAPGIYPAVTALANMASLVRGIMGPGVKLTYAADWSEYHHTDGGWYHLDALWMNSNIDVIGIDAYFPLMDSASEAQDVDTIRAGWTSGEGWDFYYSDSARTVKAPLSPPYAWKNIEWWWNHYHTQPNATTSPWVPQAKPIWFTEIGYPSVDGASNEPNVFYDPASSDGGLPRFSRGSMDIRAQRLCLQAAIAQWKNSSMVQRLFFWTWDARPYPEWPDRRDLWADGKLWAYGHWLQGKLGISHLGALVALLCARAGLKPEQIDVRALNIPVDGIALSDYSSARAAIESLAQAYFFDFVDHGTQLVARMRADASLLSVAEDALLPLSGEEGPGLQQQRVQAWELPDRVEVQHVSRARGFEAGMQRAVMPGSESSSVATLSLPLSLSDTQAQIIAQAALIEHWLQRRQVKLRLNLAQIALEPGDRILVTGAVETQRLRVLNTQIIEGFATEVDAVADDPALYPATPVGEDASPELQIPPAIPGTRLLLADMPAMPWDAPDSAFLTAACAPEGRDWRGAELQRSSGGESQLLMRQTSPSLLGTAMDVLAVGPHTLWDEMNSVTVQLFNEDALSNATHEAVLNGANVALLGKELLQFRNAEALGGGQYRLSSLLRGRLGTEDCMAGHAAGEAFLFIGQVLRVPMSHALIGTSQQYQAVTIGANVGDAPVQAFTWHARALKPYAPVQLRALRQTDGSIRLQWMRRTRVSGEFRDFVDVPLNEERESYRVWLLDISGSGVLRQWEPTAPNILYATADQTADGTASATQFRLRVAQLSSVVGEGVRAEMLLPIETAPN